MPNLIDNLLENFDGAFAQNTLRAYRSDFAHFLNWCTSNGVNPLAPNAEDLADYIADMSVELASSTISRRITSIASIFKLNEIADTTKLPPVILAMKRMHRKKGRVQAQAVPLTKDVLTKLMAVCGADLLGQRDRVMLLLGYETMRRRSEICSFRFEDIERLPLGKTAIRLRFSKTDQFGRGKLLPVSSELLAAIEQWG